MAVQWDDISYLHASIINMSSPLTRYLNTTAAKKTRFTHINDRIVLAMIQTPRLDIVCNHNAAYSYEAMIDKIWREVFILNWEGDFDKLPPIKHLTQVFRHVQTKQMYDRCKKHFVYGDKYQCCNYSNRYHDACELAPEIIEVWCVVAPALENLWLDELFGFLYFPVALACAAIVGGHVQLLDYLVNVKGIDLSRLKTIQVGSQQGYAMDFAAKYGHLEMMKYLHHTGNLPYSATAMDNAAEEGHLNIIQWLHEHTTHECTVRGVNGAIKNGFVDVIKYLRKHQLTSVSHFNMDKARDLNMIKYLHEECPVVCTTTAMDNAAFSDHLDIIEYLHENRTEGCTKNAMDKAAQWGFLNIVQYLHEHRSEGCTTQAIDEASVSGYADVVKYLVDNRSEGCTQRAMDGAVFFGCLEIVKYLHENLAVKCPISTIKNAASFGRFEIVKYLHDNQPQQCIPWGWDAAAASGHLEMVKYLLEKHPQGFTSCAMDEAADRGRFNIVQYLHQHRPEGCTTNAIDKAAAHKHWEIVQFLLDNRTEGCTTIAMDKAAEFGHIDLVMYLDTNRTEGCTTNAMDQAAANGHLNIVQYLHRNRTEGCTTNAMDNAASMGHFEIVQFLHENRTEGCTTKAMDEAASNGHVQIVKYLLDNDILNFTRHTFKLATQKGHKELLHYLHDKSTSILKDNPIKHRHKDNIEPESSWWHMPSAMMHNMAGASFMSSMRFTARSFSTKLSLLQLTNPANRHKVWHQALQVWPLEKWQNVLKKDLAVLEHQHVFAGILQDNGPMNHYYLLKAHPSMAPHVLELIVDATREYPYVHPKHREMDLIKVLRQIALATSQDSMLQAAQTTLMALVPSPDIVPLYKSIVAAAEGHSICIKPLLPALLQREQFSIVIDLLEASKNDSLPAPITDLTKLFHQLAKSPSPQDVQRAIALALGSNLESNASLYSNMLSACIKAQELSLALNVFHHDSSVQWTEPSIYALIFALSKQQEYKADIVQVYQAASVPLTARLLKHVLLAAQQMDSLSFLNQVLCDANNNGFLTELLLTCCASAMSSVHCTMHSLYHQAKRIFLDEQLAATLLLYHLQMLENEADMVHALGQLLNSINAKLGLRISNLVIAQQVRHDPSFSIAVYKALFEGTKNTMHVRGSLHALLLGLASHGHFDQVVDLLEYALVHAIKPRSDDMAAVLSAVRKHPQADQVASVILTKYLEILTSMRIPTTLRVYQHMIQLAMAINRPDLVFQVYGVMQDKRIKPTEPITMELLRAVQPRTLYGDFNKFKLVYNDAMAVGISSTRLFGLVLKVACYQHDSAFLGRVLRDIAFNATSSPPPRMVTV